jgi:hypothetical protein
MTVTKRIFMKFTFHLQLVPNMGFQDNSTNGRVAGKKFTEKNGRADM